MKAIKNLILSAAMLLGFASLASAQTALTQTTLSASVTNAQTVITVASVTGMVVPTLPGTPTTIVYVGNEAMGVTSINTTTDQIGVLRGILGTRAAAHPNGDMVLYANVTPQFLAFFQNDPPLNGACTAANTSSTPFVNVLTGAQWLCSTVTGTWVPGWNNPLAGATPEATASVASAATTTPSGPLFHLTGTTTVTTFGIPVGFNATASGGGRFCYINDSTAGTTAGNNIGATVTGTANTMVCWTWDPVNAKFYPFQ